MYNSQIQYLSFAVCHNNAKESKDFIYLVHFAIFFLEDYNTAEFLVQQIEYKISYR